MKSSLQDISEAIKQSGINYRNNEEEYFTNNPPLKEFSIEKDGELVYYGVWEGNENDFMIIFRTPDGKYHLKYKMFYDKAIIKELIQLL